MGKIEAWTGVIEGGVACLRVPRRQGLDKAVCWCTRGRNLVSFRRPTRHVRRVDPKLGRYCVIRLFDTNVFSYPSSDDVMIAGSVNLNFDLPLSRTLRNYCHLFRNASLPFKISVQANVRRGGSSL